MNNPGRANLGRITRFKAMDSPGGGARWWRSRWLKIVLAFAALLVVLAFDYPAGMPSGAEFNQSQNGTWVAARWSNSLVPPSEISDMLARLEEHDIKWIYANEGMLGPDGKLPRENFLYAGALVEYAHRARERMDVLAWISGRGPGREGGPDLANPGVRAQIVEVARYFVEQQGFDGVQLDIEPVPSGDSGFISLLDELRMALGGKTISVAAMKWTPFAPRFGPLSAFPYSWDSDYYREVGRRADQVVPMTYDSGIPLSNIYIRYTGWQTTQVLDALRDLPNCRVLMAVPTYDQETFWHHKAENIGSGLQGVVESLRELRRSGNVPLSFAGVALFAEWSTSEEEWGLYDRLWREGK